jgi:Heparinase II/III-like protein/Heparinase II/III N-terminus
VTAQPVASSRISRLARLFDRGRWYAVRLRAMPAAELPHRFIEVTRKAAWRRGRSGWDAFAAIGDGPVTDFPALRARLAKVDVSDDRLAESIRRTREGRFRFLGVEWGGDDCEPNQAWQIPPAFWFHDPVSGKAWPGAATSSFDIDVRSTGAGLGDVKYVWEPNRLQMLMPLAASIAGTQNASLRELAFAVVASWASVNPPYRGVNWKSGIELALRLVSLVVVLAAADPATLSPAQRTLIRRMIAAHARFLAAFPSLYSSANNHRVAEGLGLFLAGITVPDLDAKHGWRTAGCEILETEAERQILADGVGAEQSPTYQAFTMELLAFAVLLARDFAIPLDECVAERLACGAEYLSWLCDHNGMVPAIGDDDEGRVIAQPPDREPRYVASVATAVAGLLQRPDLQPPACAPHLRDVIFGAAPRNNPAPKELASLDPAVSGLAVFEHGGMSVIKDTIGRRRVQLVFDHGPLGLAPLAAHGHADALAIWLSVDEEPVFIDAGTFRYFSGRETRTALRESLVHNTLAIAGQSQSRAGSAFSWLSVANGRLLDAGRDSAWWAAGEHDGYQKRFGVRHVRAVRRLPSGFAIEDCLTGHHRPLAVTLRFLCGPGIEAALDGDDVTIRGRRGELCRIAPPRGFCATIAAAQFSPCFGQLAPTHQLVFAGDLSDEAALTRIVVSEPSTADGPRTHVATPADAPEFTS